MYLFHCDGRIAEVSFKYSYIKMFHLVDIVRVYFRYRHIRVQLMWKRQICVIFRHDLWLRHRLANLSAVVHDDACHVLRYSLKRQNHSLLAKQVSELSWILDRFHVRGHRDSWCLSRCHPDLFPEITRGMNTSACESINHIIGRHKYVYRVMSPGIRYFFLQEVVESRNTLQHAGTKRMGDGDWLDGVAIPEPWSNVMECVLEVADWGEYFS